MGRLVIFRRQIELASDDIYVPAFGGVCFHTVWGILISLLYTFLHQQSVLSSCQISLPFEYYVWLYLINVGLELPLELSIMVISMMGTISSVGPRKYLTALAHIHTIVILSEIALHSYGVYASYFAPTSPVVCSDATGNDHSEAVMLEMAHVVQIAGIVAVSLYLIMFSAVMYLSRQNRRTEFDKYLGIWNDRIKRFFSIKEIMSDGEDVMLEVSRQLAMYFRDIDWAPSDMIAGLLLLKREQKKLQRERNRMQKYQAQRRLSRQRSIEAFRLSSTNLSEAESSIHTSLSRPHTRSSHLRPPPLKPISSLSLNSELEASDDALGAAELPTPLTSFDRQGIPHHGPITKSDIPDVLYFARYAELVYNHQEAKAIAPILLIHFNEANNLFKSPYMIIFDHEWQCVVIAIRGTYSITDILVDMHFAEAPLDIPELPEGKHGCHPGMLRTSLNILEDITKEDRLRKILLDPDSEYSHYNLVVTGHSLGAGIAALLCYMLRKEGFSNAKCYSYCPPGQLLTREVAEHFAQFCISVVNGDDLVPRTTRNSLELLKRDIEELLADCELAKWQLFKSVLGNYCCGSRTRSNKVELDPEAVPDNLRARDSSLDKLDKLDMSVFPTKPKLRVGTITMDVDGAEAHVPITLMFMAGRILYIEKLPVDLSISSDNINENATLKKQLSFNEIRPTNKSHRHSVLAVFRPDWTKPQDPIPAGDSSHLPQSSPSTPQSSASAISGTAFRYKYVPRWAEREEFCEIILSKSMLTDHSPFAVIKDFWKMSEGQILQTLRK